MPLQQVLLGHAGKIVHCWDSVPLREGRAWVIDALRKSQDRNVLMLAALTFARAGNTEQFQKLVEKLNQLFANYFTIQTFNLPATRAAIKLVQNGPVAAIEILRPLTPYDLAISGSFDNVSCVPSRPWLSPTQARGPCSGRVSKGSQSFWRRSGFRNGRSFHPAVGARPGTHAR